MNNKEFSWKKFMEDLTQKNETLNIPTSIPTEEYMRKVLQGHIDMINKIGTTPTFFYYADDIRAEDPVGTTTLLGKKGLTEDFAKFFDVPFIPKKAELVAPISTSFGNAAAMTFKFYAEVDGQDISIDIIEVIKFNESGEIIEQMAYWGRENVKILLK
ncbi:nuclear transport factor 2 family protein [Paenibacillus pabuli]|uniref:nuclear transport factor 2 family protein n=1 Tax=Paenibacillus pabuli TaxID=1472 RepID=UPI0032420221